MSEVLSGASTAN